MLLLNLGCGPDIREGFDNLTLPDWRFEDGLRQYGDETVDGITIGCTLYQVPEEHWPLVFEEIARVLRPGGVVRITEPDADNVRDDPVAFAHAAVYTTWQKVSEYLWGNGLLVAPHLRPGETDFQDDRLENGRTPPRVFIIEGIK